MKPVSKREARKETRAILVFLAIIAVMLIVASYGYFTGAWTEQP